MKIVEYDYSCPICNQKPVNGPIDGWYSCRGNHGFNPENKACHAILTPNFTVRVNVKEDSNG